MVATDTPASSSQHVAIDIADNNNPATNRGDHHPFNHQLADQFLDKESILAYRYIIGDLPQAVHSQTPAQAVQYDNSNASPAVVILPHDHIYSCLIPFQPRLNPRSTHFRLELLSKIKNLSALLRYIVLLNAGLTLFFSVLFWPNFLSFIFIALGWFGLVYYHSVLLSVYFIELLVVLASRCYIFADNFTANPRYFQAILCVDLVVTVYLLLQLAVLIILLRSSAFPRDIALLRGDELYIQEVYMELNSGENNNVMHGATSGYNRSKSIRRGKLHRQKRNALHKHKKFHGAPIMRENSKVLPQIDEQKQAEEPRAMDLLAVGKRPQEPYNHTPTHPVTPKI
jgi:hypothetical protein